jgi:TolB-like protein
MPELKSYRFGPFLVDRRSACLRRDGVVVPLRPKSFDVLVYLAQHPGRLVPKAELIDGVWQNLNVTPNSLAQCIKEIRQALRDDTLAIIETVSKRGYLFALPVIAIGGDEAPLSADAGGSGALPLPDRPSIAVLPFDNMSGDPAEDYFADGISEDLITGLSRIRWLFVIARNSTFVYKGRAVDVRQVASKLGVRYVLEGSVRRAGQRLRISAQLIDAVTGGHHWAEQYDRELGDIFAIQDEITSSVVASIQPRLLAAEGVRAFSRSSDDLGAWELVARANPCLAAQSI